MSMYVCYCVLNNGSGSLRIVRRLSKLQEYYEKISEPKLPQQAFVYGDGEASCLPFQTYPKGWRTGMNAGMARCRLQDLLALSWRILDCAMRKQPEAAFKLIILGDGPVRAEEGSVNLTGERLKELKEKGLEIIFVCCSPDACSGKLETLVSKEICDGEDITAALGGS